jgi:hypothetical protein
MSRKDITTARAKVAAAKRHHPDADHTELQQDLKALTLQEHVRRLVETWPPLTPEQSERIAVLLRPGGGSA